MPIDLHETDPGLIRSSRLWIPLAIVLAAGIAQKQFQPMNADAAWHLYTAGRILDAPYLMRT